MNLSTPMFLEQLEQFFNAAIETLNGTIDGLIRSIRSCKRQQRVIQFIPQAGGSLITLEQQFKYGFVLVLGG